MGFLVAAVIVKHQVRNLFSQGFFVHRFLLTPAGRWAALPGIFHRSLVLGNLATLRRPHPARNLRNA